MNDDKSGLVLPENVRRLRENQVKQQENRSIFKNCFVMRRKSMDGSLAASPVTIIAEGPHQGFAKLEMVGYALIPMEEFTAWRSRWRACKLIRQVVRAMMRRTKIRKDAQGKPK